MQIHVALRHRVWSGRTREKNVLWFLRYTFLKNFFALFFGSRRARTRGPILTIYMSYEVLPHKDVPFGGSRSYCSLFWG